jgi:hypothetical protein
MTISLMLTALLAWAPPSEPHQQSQTQLESASDAIAEVSPAEAITLLEAALAEALTHPQDLLSDPTAADRLARARLALVWAYLAEGKTSEATATMDIAIRSAGARALPLAGLGPTIRTLHDERRAELEAKGHGTIAVHCDGCEVLIDEAKSENPSGPLLLGIHRVWVFDPRGEIEPMFTGVQLGSPGQTEWLVFRAVPSDEWTTAAPRRAPTKIPRWAKIVGMSIGAGLVVAGGVMLARDKCRDGSSPSPDKLDSPGCGRNRNKVPDIALIGVGAGLFMGASVWLGIDEARAGQARRVSAMVGWTLRF